MDEAPRRIRISTLFTAFAVVVTFVWCGHLLARSREIAEQMMIPLSQIYVTLVQVPLALWYAIAIALGAAFCAKDLWFEERRARHIDALAIPVFFLLFLLVHHVSQEPFMSLLQALLRR